MRTYILMPIRREPLEPGSAKIRLEPSCWGQRHQSSRRSQERCGPATRGTRRTVGITCGLAFGDKYRVYLSHNHDQGIEEPS